ncbi:MAG: IclR family transcriptional regulator C-terminal domain-containing protein [Pseudomonadota bacterium]
MYLERLLTILDSVQQGDTGQGQSVSDIVASTGLPKPSVYRQVKDLVDTGLLQPCGQGRFAIGLRARRLAGQRDPDDLIRETAVPLLKAAASALGAAVFFSRSRGTSVEIVHTEVPQTGVSYLHPGMGPRPLHACSCAKAIAAFSADPDMREALSKRLKAFTEHTKTELKDLEFEFAQIRQRGYAVCAEELERGICSVAAPLQRPGQPIRFSIGVTGTTRALPSDAREDLGRAVIDICRDLGARLEQAAAHPAGLSASG